MLLYVWDALRVKGRWMSDVEKSPSLDVLLTSVLCRLVQQRLRIGLGREYRREDAEIPGIRGRLDFAESLKRMSFHEGRACCRFERLNMNVPRNQILRSVLGRLIQTGEFGLDRRNVTRLRGALRRLVREMAGVEMIELSLDAIRRELLKRQDADYALMLEICQLLLLRQMPRETAGEHRLLDLDRESLTLHDIYEKFVAKFYAYHLQDWGVGSQMSMLWPTDAPSCYLPRMIPDVTLTNRDTGDIIVLDTKFTGSVLTAGRWGNLTFNRDHMFQIYAYLRSQEEGSDSLRASTGVLLYPTVQHGIQERVRIQGHDIWWITVDLAQPWERVEQDLLGIVPLVT